jgi:hypothetical protein
MKTIQDIRPTEYRMLQIMERRTTLLRAITSWTAAQAVYMPEVVQARSSDDFSFSIAECRLFSALHSHTYL